MSEQNYNILNNFPPDEYNLLVPVQSIQEVNPIYKIVVNQVYISTNLDDGEIYEEKNATGDAKYALTHKALLKLMTAANGQVVETTRVKPKVCEKCIDMVKVTGQAPACGNCACSANVAYRVTLKFPEMSGGWRIVQATREIDFSNTGNMKPGQIARMKEFASEHAESKAMSRCIRKGLNIKNAYTLEELSKPFVVAYPVLDARDPEVKKALIAGSLASSNLLYGSGLSVPQLEAARDEIDMETGEIIEADYAAETPETSEPVDICEACGIDLAPNVVEYSMKKFKRKLCYKCQRGADKK